MDNLESDGHVKRVQSDEDRRKVLVVLTDKTRKMLNVYIDVSVEMTNVFYKGFQPEEIDQFEAFLERVLDNLIKHEEQ